MAASGINKRVLGKFGGEVHNFISDPDVAAEAKERGLTRSAVCMERAASLGKPLVYAVGNEYQIMALVKQDLPVVMWVEVNGKSYYDASNGILRSARSSHRMTVPQSELNAAKSGFWLPEGFKFIPFMIRLPAPEKEETTEENGQQ